MKIKPNNIKLTWFDLLKKIIYWKNLNTFIYLKIIFNYIYFFLCVIYLILKKNTLKYIKKY